MMKEPFILKENLLFIESWMNKNENLIAGFTTIKGGTSIDKFEGLNIAYHVGDEPEAVLKNIKQSFSGINFINFRNINI